MDHGQACFQNRIGICKGVESNAAGVPGNEIAVQQELADGAEHVGETCGNLCVQDSGTRLVL